MIAVFYDRKNDQVVRSHQLMSTTVVETNLAIDCGSRVHGEWQGRKKEKSYLKEKIVSNLCYKTTACPKSQNWDKHTNIEHLVFLRLENETISKTEGEV